MSAAVEVRERGIPMQDQSVIGVRAGIKTQTRRVVTDRNSLGNAKASQLALSRAWVDTGPSPAGNTGPYLKSHLAADFAEKNGWPKDSIIERLYPRWEVGDWLWVREAWQYADWTEEGEPIVRYRADGETRVFLGNAVPEDWADRVQSVWAELSAPANYAIDNRAADRRWRSPRFMPRWASRLTLEITEVRVQRVQEISEDDAIAEGVKFFPRLRPDDPPAGYGFDGTLVRELTAKDAFARLWDFINLPRGYSFESNIWVWALSFRAVTP